MPFEPECHSQASFYRYIFVEVFNIFFQLITIIILKYFTLNCNSNLQSSF